MYSILIVDDEPMIRNGIKNALDWPSIGVTTVLTAGSGKAALNILCESNIDIMLTDINMDGMDGLELISKAKSLNCNLKVIVLTGFEDFGYARESLRLKVNEFLLKPVDEVLLLDTVKEQIQHIEDEKEQKRLDINQQRAFGTIDQLQLESILKKLLKNDLVTDQELNYLKEHYNYDLKMNLQVVVLIPSREQGIDTQVDPFRAYYIRNTCVGLIDSKNLGITISGDKNNILIIYFQQEGTNGTVEKMEELTSILKSEKGFSPKVLIGSEIEGFNNLHVSYNDALYLLKNKKDSYREVFHIKQSRFNLDNYIEVFSKLKNSIMNNIADKEEVLHIFDVFIESVDSYNLTEKFVRSCCFELVNAAYYAYINSSNDDITDWKVCSFIKLLSTSTKDDVYEISKSTLSLLFTENEKSTHKIINDAKVYIKENLGNDLYVNDIADYFNVTANYFSRLFKKVTNMGCNEYIVKVRMEKAITLLENTSLKVCKISELVGYRNTNYFSLAFKKFTNKSPKQFRDDFRSK